MRCLCSASSITTLHWCRDSSIGRVNIARNGRLQAAGGSRNRAHSSKQRTWFRLRVHAGLGGDGRADSGNVDFMLMVQKRVDGNFQYRLQVVQYTIAITTSSKRSNVYEV